MKKIFLFALAASFLFFSCKDKETRIVVDTEMPAELTSRDDSLSWALGFSLAQNAATTGLKINREELFKAFCYTLDGKEQPLTREQMFELINELEARAQYNQLNNQKSMAEDVSLREEAYFSQLVKENPNVKKSDKGFYYEVLKEGTGKKGEVGQVVVFDYKGSFTNGQVFDQTYGNREPITHVISESIFPGLFEGFQMMSAGSTYRFYFPSAVAFGPRGTDRIPPNTIIIYDVEVHDIHD